MRSFLCFLIKMRNGILFTRLLPPDSGLDGSGMLDLGKWYLDWFYVV